MDRRRFSGILFSGACALGLVGCADDPPPPGSGLAERTDEAVDRALRWLVSSQDADGAWRSRTYGALKDGFSLTPAVVKALVHADRPDARDAARKGARWLSTHDPKDVADRLIYPVYTASLIVMGLVRLDDDTLRPAKNAWVDELRRHQLAEGLGWTADDEAYGGWGYGVTPLKRPSRDTIQPPFDADLSSTLFAVGALRMAGAPDEDAAVMKARRFVFRCQNFADEPVRSDPEFDDGGFFFTPTRQLPNKAGVAGVDRHGRRRYRSYGSLTGDGVRALLRCGLSPTHSRVVAARRWLEDAFDVHRNPGAFDGARQSEQAASYYYWCWAAAHALRMLGRATFEQRGRTVRWGNEMASALVKRQREDGSWRNRFTLVKEDDPIIATTLATSAVALSRALLVD